LIEVHSTAVVHPTAKLAEGVRIGPYAVIGEQVSLGEGTAIGPHAVVDAFTTIGRDCQVFSGAVVGSPSQDLKHQGEVSYLVVGDRNVIREFVTINRATGVGDETRIGSDNLLMAYVHVAHDCVVGDNVVLANGVTLGGHVVLEDCVTIGGMVGLHQFIRVGRHAMIGAMSRLAQDVLPYLLIEGNPPKVYGPNSVGLRRRGLDSQTRGAIKRAYRLLYRSGLNVSQATARLEEECRQFPEVAHLVRFLSGTRRGITGLTGKASLGDDGD
jgi:UDP-N-acetylglucosamine acyltransferase